MLVFFCPPAPSWRRRTGGQEREEDRAIRVCVMGMGYVGVPLAVEFARSGLDVVGEAASGRAALEMVERLAPDVVLMDLVMPGMDGVETTRRILAANSDARVLVLTSFSEDDKIFPALEAGAMGYLLKDIPAEDLGRAIRTVAAGEFLLHRQVAGKVIRGVRPSRESEMVKKPPPVKEALTPREVQVLTLVARG